MEGLSVRRAKPPVMENVACGPGRGDHHAAQAGMGMDPGSAVPDDGKVDLCRRRAEQDHVARREGGRSQDKAAGCAIGQPVIWPGKAQRIVVGQGDAPPDPRQRGAKQADAIEPVPGIAAVKAKGNADKVCGGQSSA